MLKCLNVRKCLLLLHICNQLKSFRVHALQAKQFNVLLKTLSCKKNQFASLTFLFALLLLTAAAVCETNYK
jgi:hypothetical protein